MAEGVKVVIQIVDCCRWRLPSLCWCVCSKGDYDGAITQYLETIRYVEPSYGKRSADLAARCPTNAVLVVCL